MSRLHLSSLVSLCASLSLALCLSAGVSACGSDDDGSGGGPDAGSGDPCAGPIPSFSEVTIFEICTNCHSSELSGPDRNQAPANVNFDTYEAAKADAALAAQEVMFGLMPAAPYQDDATEQQKQDLYTWAACGTPDETGRETGARAPGYSAPGSAPRSPDATSPW